MRKARICVTVGWSYGDPHLKNPIREANVRGMTLINVSPSGQTDEFGGRNEQLKARAKEAFESNAILNAVHKYAGMT